MATLEHLEHSTFQKIDLFQNMADFDHEELLFCYDQSTGLKGIISIHSTILGPAMGGTRMWDYANEQEAIVDALRLARGMTYKSALSGLNVGGGKAVLIGDAKSLKSEVYFRRFGKFIDNLNGKFVTAGDVNMGPDDLEFIARETNHVTGLPARLGGSGSSSPITAYGTYMGMKAAAGIAYGNDSLQGKKIGVEGVGSVGKVLVEYLKKEKADIYIFDIQEKKLKEVADEYFVNIVNQKDFFDLDMDIYAPCALGATINDNTVDRLKCKIIAGAANNQLAHEINHSRRLAKNGIIYAPDFLINSGGIMAVEAEYFGHYSKELIYSRVEKLYDICREVIRKGLDKNISTHEAAMELAEKRIQAIGKIKQRI